MMRLLTLFAFASTFLSANAFTSAPASFARKSIQLTAAKENQNEPMTRRDVGIKSAVVAASAGILAFNMNTQTAKAEGEAVDGRLIEFVVENLGGEAGQTGRFVMRMRPEWAPNGVARFEKLTEIGFW